METTSRVSVFGISAARWARVLLVLAAVAAIAGTALAGERVTNGTFGSSTGWTNWTERGSITRDFNSSTGGPTGGSPPHLRYYAGSNFNGGVWQPVTLIGGQTYTLSGFFRDYNGSDTWAEVLIGTSAPVDGSDYGNGLMIKSDTWSCNDWNQPFSAACVKNTTTYVCPGTGVQTLYLVLKVGMGGSIDTTFDSVSLQGPSPMTYSAISMSNTAVVADGTTNYTVSFTATDPDGVSDIKDMRVMLGGCCVSANARGYMVWGQTDADVNFFGNLTILGDATGGGRWGWHSTDWGYQYITPVACSTTTSGNSRTVTFTFKAKTNWPCGAGLPVGMLARDAIMNYGWSNSNAAPWNLVFDATPPPDANCKGSLTVAPNVGPYARVSAADVDSGSTPEAIALYPTDSSGVIESYVVENDITSIRVMSIFDGNQIRKNGTLQATLNRGQYADISVAAGDVISGSRPYCADYNGQTEKQNSTLVPKSFAGTKFAVYCSRDTGKIAFRTLGQASTVTIYENGLVTQKQTLSIPANSTAESVALTNGAVYVIAATSPVLAHYMGATTSDGFPLPPADTEIFGVPSNNAHLVFAENNTTYTCYKSDGTIALKSDSSPATGTANAGERVQLPGVAQGNAFGIRVVADKPVAATSVGDADGGDGTSWYPKWALARSFIIPRSTEYFVVVPQMPGATILITNSAGSLGISDGVYAGGGTGSGPGFRHFGSTTSVSGTVAAGTRIFCSKPAFVYFEPDDDDEANLNGDLNALMLSASETVTLNAVNIFGLTDTCTAAVTVSGACPPPNPPTGGSAVVDSSSQITWGWTRASGASGELYLVYDAATGGNLKATSAAQATSVAETGISPNTLCARWVATFKDCESATRLALPQKYSFANVPAAPTVGGATATTLNVSINENSNPAATTFAIKCVQGATTRYVQLDGTLGATEVWQSKSAWGTKTVTGLDGSTTYTFSAAALNGDGVATQYGPTANGTTLCGYTDEFLTNGALNRALTGGDFCQTNAGAFSGWVLSNAATWYNEDRLKANPMGCANPAEPVIRQAFGLAQGGKCYTASFKMRHDDYHPSGSGAWAKGWGSLTVFYYTDSGMTTPCSPASHTTGNVTNATKNDMYTISMEHSTPADCRFILVEVRGHAEQFNGGYGFTDIDDVSFKSDGTIACTVPAITAHPSNATRDVGQTATFTVAASGTAPLAYRWQKRPSGGSWADVTDGTGADTPSYTTAVLTAADDQARFRCVVTSPCGSTNSNAATLTVNSPIPAAPTDPTASGIAVDSIKWGWTDNSTNETGFKVYAGPGATAPVELTYTTAVDATWWDHTGLSANTQYAFQVAATNAYGDSAKTPNLAAYTLAKAPAYGTSGDATVSCDRDETAFVAAGAAVKFTATNGFGDGPDKVGSFGYLWNTSSGDPADWAGEQFWTTGTLTKNAGASGSYYLHIRSYNNDATPLVNSTVLNLGPYTVDTTAPSITDVTPSALCVRTGDSIALTADVSDAGVGVELAGIELWGQNLLANYSFETGNTQGWAGDLTTINNNYPNPGTAKDGARWVGASAGYSSGIETRELRQVVSVEPGAAYRLSAWIWTDGSPNPVTASLQWKDGAAGGNGECTTVAGFTSNTSGWQQLTASVTPTGSQLTFAVKMSWDKSGAGGGGNFDLARVVRTLGPDSYVNDIATWNSVTIGSAGALTVFAQDAAGNSATADSAVISTDDAAPSGSIEINGGANYSRTTSVSLGISATDTGCAGLNAMRFSNDGSNWSAWEAYAASKSWTLEPGDGEKTVYVQFSDALGNVSSSFTDTIILDGTPPTVSIGAPSASATSGGPVSFTVTYGGADSVTLAAGDITLNTTGGATGTVNVSGSGSAERTVTISDITGDGTIGISIAAGTASDLADNAAPSAGPSETFAVDNTAPYVVNVTSTDDDGTYGVDDTIVIHVQFSEAVTVTGTLDLELETGDIDRVAVYTGGSGTDTLSFEYTVEAGDASADLDYVSADSLTLGSGASVKDAVGNNADLTLPEPGEEGSLGYNKDLVISTCSPPEITVHPVGGSVCPGGSLTLSVTASGTEPLAYQWKKDTIEIEGAESSSYEATQAGSYTCVVSNECGSDESDAAVVAVKAATQITAHPEGGSFCPGGHLDLSVTASGEGTLGYQWKKDNEPISGAESSSYQASEAGSYTCVVTGECGSVESNAAVVIAASTPTVVSITPSTLGPTSADSLDFAVVFSEDVTGFDQASDVTVAHSGTSHTGLSITSGSGTDYTVTVSGISGDGSLTLSVNEGAAQSESAGCDSAGGGPSAAVAIDNTDPVVAILSIQQDDIDLITPPSSENALQGDVTIVFTVDDDNPGGTPVVTVLDANDQEIATGEVESSGGNAYTVTATIDETTANGLASVTVGAQDAAGNNGYDVAEFNVNKTQAEISVTIPNAVGTRCLTFRFGGDGSGSVPPFERSVAVTFVDGTAQVVLSDIPYSALWTCLSIKDRLHTLRTTVDLAGIDGQYAPAIPGDVALIGGDLNNDNLVDILDFGVFIGQYGRTVDGPGCDWVGRHADIDGDGVVGTSDFTFIQGNFLKKGDADCLNAQVSGLSISSLPRTSVTVEELRRTGVQNPEAADINGDGMVDLWDVSLFVQSMFSRGR